jgi:hypothetical protein
VGGGRSPHRFERAHDAIVAAWTLRRTSRCQAGAVAQPAVVAEVSAAAGEVAVVDVAVVEVDTVEVDAVELGVVDVGVDGVVDGVLVEVVEVVVEVAGGSGGAVTVEPGTDVGASLVGSDDEVDG